MRSVRQKETDYGGTDGTGTFMKRYVMSSKSDRSYFKAPGRPGNTCFLVSVKVVKYIGKN